MADLEYDPGTEGDVFTPSDDIPIQPAPSALPLMTDGESIPGGNSPVARGISPGDTTTVPVALNRNATNIDLLATYCAGFGVANGLRLSADPIGLTLTISAGHALIGGIVELAEDTILALPDDSTPDQLYVWLLQNGTLTYRTTTVAVAYAVFIGSCITDSGVISDINYSGVVWVSGGSLIRRTLDYGTPVDTPAAAVMLAKTTNGLFVWDGEQYWGVGSSAGVRAKIVVNAKFITMAAAGISYRLGLDFSAEGEFEDVGYHAVLTCDAEGVIITENLGRKTASYAEWAIFVPSDTGVGTYGGQLDLKLLATLIGWGWTGNSTLISGVWDSPTEVLE